MIWLTALNVVGAVFPFFIRMFMTRRMGADYLGLSSLCLSVLNVLNVANLGIDGALSYHLYKPIHENDVQRINQLLSFYRKIYAFIGTVIIVLGLIITPFLVFLIKGDIPDDINLQVVFVLYLLNNVIGYYIVVHQQMITNAYQDAAVSSQIMLMQYFFMYGLQFVFIYLHNYYMYVVVMILSYVLVALLYYIHIKKSYPGIEFSSDFPIERSFVAYAFRDAVSVAIYKVRDVFRNSVDSVVLSAMFGLTIVGYYQNYYVVMCAAILFSEILQKSVTASLGDLHSTGDLKSLRNIYCVILYVQLFMSGMCAIIYLTLVQDFMIIWIGPETVMPFSTAIAMAIYVYILGFSFIMVMLRSSSGYWRKGRINAGVETVLNLGLNIVLAYLFGTTGIVLATILSMCIVYLPFEIYWMSRDVLKMSPIVSIRIIFENLGWLVVSMIMVGGACMFVPEIYFWRLVIKLFVAIIVPVFLFVAINHHNDRYLEIKGLITKAILSRIGKKV